jgi:hypothetical protein
MPRKLKLKVLESAPCTQPWNAMQGNERERHCASCNKQVHNFVAMSQRQIEQLIRDREGRLCARVTYLSDGSIRTADGLSQPSVAASVVLAASLAFGASAVAEGRTDTPAAGKATLTGIVLSADGSAPLVGAVVGLRSDGQPVEVARTDAQGKFVVTAKPGQYDISVGTSIFFGMHIRGADLHEGEQSLQPIRLGSETTSENVIDTVTGGELVSTYRYPISYLFKHPLRYLKHLPHQL